MYPHHAHSSNNWKHLKRNKNAVNIGFLFDVAKSLNYKI
jgi:hypothetical protein